MTLTYLLLLVSFKDEITTRTSVCVSCKIGVDDNFNPPLFLYERRKTSDDGSKIGSLCETCYKKMERDHYLFTLKTEIKNDIDKNMQRALGSGISVNEGTHKDYVLVLEDLSCSDLRDTSTSPIDKQDPSLTANVGLHGQWRSQSTPRMVDAGTTCTFVEEYQDSEVRSAP